MPEADPQNRSHPPTPLSAIQDELATDKEQEDNKPLLQPSHTTMTRQTLTLIALTVRSQHKPALGGPQKPRRSLRNSKEATQISSFPGKVHERRIRKREDIRCCYRFLSLVISVFHNI
jgi:hypothetical protein